MNATTMNMHGNSNQTMHHAHPDDPQKQSEHTAVHNLITHQTATHIAINNGSWFNPNTWKDGRIPGANARVVIPKELNVTYDNVSNTRLFGLRVDGHLKFATDTDTKMVIDTFLVSSEGTLTIGTKDNPVQGNVQTEILIADNGAIDKKWDPQQLSRGIVSHGTVNIHGQAKTSHLKVAVDPSAGDKTLTLADIPINWQVGDRIILTGTQYQVDGTQDEQRVITAINDNRITLDIPLDYNHKTPRSDLKAYVANQSRNIIFATENANKLPPNQRGHVMFMHSDNVDVRYAEFHELGRTDKSKLLDDFKTTSGHAPKRILDNQGNPITGARNNIRGRYAVHLHRTGVNGDEKPAVLVGNSVVGSPGWGIVQHDSHAVLENNLTYDVVGSGFVSETGNEIGAWRNNISIKNQGRSGNEKGGAYNHDLGFGGHGFWFQGRLVESEGNVTAGNSGAGIFYFHRGVDQIDPLSDNLAIEAWAKGLDTISTSDSPIMGFKDNEVLASETGLFVIKNSQVQKHDGRTVLDGLKAWEVVEGTDLQYTAHYTVKDFDLLGTKTSLHKNAPNDGVLLFHNVEDMVFDNLKVEGFSRGVNLNKETPVGKTLNNWGYIFVDTQLKNNKQDWINLDRKVDKFISRKDIQPGKLGFQIDNAKSDLVATATDNKVQDAISIVGTKTDSLGAIALPFGNEKLAYPIHQLRQIAKQQGYYTLPNGRSGVIVDEYISDRLTGDMRKYQFFATIENQSWLKNDKSPHLGTLDVNSLEKGGKIIPFRTLDFNHPEFTNNKIQPSTSKAKNPAPPITNSTAPVQQQPTVKTTQPLAAPSSNNKGSTIQIEAELYNIDDFKDVNTANRGGAGDAVRRPLAVDVAKNGIDDGLNVGWISKGEYLTYTVEVPESGNYRMSANIASKVQRGHRLKVSVDGESATANFGQTGGWQKWQTASGDGVLNLAAGTHTLRVDMLSSGFNLDYVKLERMGVATENKAVMQATEPAAPPTTSNLIKAGQTSPSGDALVGDTSVGSNIIQDTVTGGSGNDKRIGSNAHERFDLGTASSYDIVSGRGGNDIFVLNRGSGYLIIRDFQDGNDKLELSDGLTFGAIEQTRKNGKTFISTGGDTLAELTNFTGTLTSEDFATAS